MFRSDKSGDRTVASLLLAIVALAVVLRVLPYLLNGYYFEIGFDTGTYERILRDFLSSPDWTVLPASPGPPYPSWANNDPAFFVTSVWYTLISGTDVNSLFRWVWPVIVGVLYPLVSYAISRDLTGSKGCGLITSFLVAISAVQANAVFESFWKQTLASLFLMLFMYFFHRFHRSGRWRDVVLALLFLVGTLIYHSAFGVIVVAGVFSVALYMFSKGDWDKIRKLIPACVMALALFLPLMMIRQGTLSDYLDNFLYYSWEGIQTFFLGGSNHEGGGGMSGLLGGHVHVTLLYILCFPATFLFALLSFRHRKEEGFSIYHIMFTLLFLYCLLWFYFANRFVIDLDLLVCILAPLGAITAYGILTRPHSRRITGASRVVLALLVVLLVYSPVISIANIADTEPYIVDDDFLDWADSGLDRDNFFIVANDRVSTCLLQKEYYVSLHTLSDEQIDEFLLTSPDSWSEIVFIKYYNSVIASRDIVVILSAYDYDTPLENGQFVPVDDYASSSFFEQIYAGDGYIKFVYRVLMP